MNWSSLATGLLALALSAPALAVDGVAEINHTCATLTGCFPGDTPGYPVRIDGQAGSSYRLTSDLIVPEEDVDGINTSASNLRIDLNGFQIVRAGCENLLTCTVLSGNGTGIHASARGVTVVNGSVIGMGDRGVRIVGFGGLVRGVQTRFNGGNGIDVDNASIVEKCESLSNGGHGIEGRGSTVLESAVRANVGDGIFDGGDAAIVARNTVRFNGGNGITVGAGSLVESNAVSDNTGFGLSIPADAGYRANTVQNNTGGTVSNGTQLGSNLCNGTITCP